MYISGVQRIKYKLRSLELQRGLFKDKTEPASNHKIQNTQTESIIMVHSVKNHKKREKEMRMLKKRAKGLAKLASHHKEGILEMKLSYRM
jgi:hypothetical protein